MGAIPREEMSMQAIRRWLAEHPDRADALMNENPSYVFFRTLDSLDASLGPLGAQGVPLTPEVSLAVDPRFVPYGAPLFLTTRRPTTPADTSGETAAPPASPPPDTATVPFRRLMIAQDTGGAIRGAIRGDVFWGAGPRARSIAGRMKSPGRYTVLLPRTL
jgi:membrane-bound lytic murein transglycosylase A